MNIYLNEYISLTLLSSVHFLPIPISSDIIDYVEHEKETHIVCACVCGREQVSMYVRKQIRPIIKVCVCMFARGGQRSSELVIFFVPFHLKIFSFSVFTCVCIYMFFRCMRMHMSVHVCRQPWLFSEIMLHGFPP